MIKPFLNYKCTQSLYLQFCYFSCRLRVNIEVQILAIWVHGSFDKVPMPTPHYYLSQGLTEPGAYLTSLARLAGQRSQVIILLSSSPLC